MSQKSETIKDIARRSTAELVGTFFLTMSVGLSAGGGPAVPGAALMVMVFAFGHISLGSFNPAVTLGLTLRPGKLIGWRSFFAYCTAEFLGGLLGALVAVGFAGAETVVPVKGSPASLVQIFFAELLGTFALVTVVLNTGTSADLEGNSFYGLAIGGTLFLSALIFGNISGAVLNPAVAFLCLVAPVHSTAIPSAAWVFFIAPPLAAALAVMLFYWLSPKDTAPREVLLHGPVDHRVSAVPGAGGHLYTSLETAETRK